MDRHSGTPIGPGGLERAIRLEKCLSNVRASNVRAMSAMSANVRDRHAIDILTTDGILGRDALGESSPMPSSIAWQPRAQSGNRRAMAVPRAAAVPEPFAPADN